MQVTVTLGSTLSLFGAMVILAAIPGLSVLVVATRSATFGFLHGVLTTIGIVVGDIVFILIAMGGLSLFAETLGGMSTAIKYIGGIYLIFLGLGLCRSKVKAIEAQAVTKASWTSSVLTGLMITLGDQKATLFYFGFFPAFLDISQMSFADMGIVIAIATVAIGSVKLIYALMADRARRLVNSRIRKVLNVVAGGLIVAVGIFLMLKN